MKVAYSYKSNMIFLIFVQLVVFQMVASEFLNESINQERQNMTLVSVDALEDSTTKESIENHDEFSEIEKESSTYSSQLRITKDPLINTDDSLVNNESSSERNTNKAACYWVNLENFNFWDLSDLETDDDEEDRSFDTGKGYLLKYSFCADTHIQCNEGGSQVALVKKGKEECEFRLAGTIDDFNLWEMKDSEDPSKGITITMNKGDNSRFVKWDLSCNEDMEDGEITILNKSQMSISDNPLLIKAETKSACPVANFYFMTKFIKDNKNWVGVIMIVVGLGFALIGAKFFWITIIALLSIVFIVILFIIYFIIQSIFNIGGGTWVIIVILAVGIILGVSIGMCFKSLTSFFFVLFGMLLGYLLGLLIWDLGLSQIETNQTVVYWVTIAVLVVIGGFVGYKFMKMMFIVVTSFLGCYLIIKAISMWAGGFPDEAVLIDLITSQEWDQVEEMMNGTVYAYLGGWLVGSVIAMFFQSHHTKDLSDDDFRGRK
mmetsp:Transcript_12174/g.12576  ORF Transcript_12174/g.12576 Transcript_12174/m.12576 type:complete len:489 (-) Transcript_12174:32-1498(-)